LIVNELRNLESLTHSHFVEQEYKYLIPPQIQAKKEKEKEFVPSKNFDLAKNNFWFKEAAFHFASFVQFRNAVPR
jgi:hypothetical protein